MELSGDATAEDTAANTARLIKETTSNSHEAPGQAGKRWRNALHKLQSLDMDPWLDFSAHHAPTQTAIRHRYSVIKKKWVADEIQIKMESKSFDRGAMRRCFRLKKLPQVGSHIGDWNYASNYVAKNYISNVDRQVYFDDVRLQMEAKLWGEAFNRQNPPKKVDIFQLSVLEINQSAMPTCDQQTAPTSTSLYHIERFMEGEYRKYNSNSGFVDEQLRNTPQAFSHFTFERSGHRLLVVDIQGVGDLYTDPQIHTADGVGYSDGNLGPRGMAYFFHSHLCNPLCTFLGLTPFDLAPTELACLDEQESAEPVAPEIVDEEQSEEIECSQHNGVDLPSDHAALNGNASSIDGSQNQPTVRQRFIAGPRRRAVSFNHNRPTSRVTTPTRFGPTVARSTENMSPSVGFARRRYDSGSICSEVGSRSHHPVTTDSLLFFDHSSRLNLLDFEDTDGTATCKLVGGLVDQQVPINRTTVYPLGDGYPRPLFIPDPLIPGGCVSPRNRIASGDSGYFGRLNLHTPSGFSEDGLPQHQSFFPELGLYMGSTSSLVEVSLPDSPNLLCMQSQPVSFGAGGDVGGGGGNLSLANTLRGSLADETFHRPMNPLFGAWNPRGLQLRRQRSLSESSDIDATEEDHRVAGNLLHQMMHESQKPSCADHPTNLDQEIGHSILGQLHHELARLHEGGRFIPSCKGGWSHAGLGGHLLGNSPESSVQSHDEVIGPIVSSSIAPEMDIRPPVSPTTSVVSETGSPEEKSIDWTAVVFHERHAAQLGCLEAMITMAHYHLGLPTQLMFDCPIKPDQNDLRSGIDYLWRAAEGGDRRCMIILARYLDLSVTLSDTVSDSKSQSTSAAPPNDFLLLPALLTATRDALPAVGQDSWAESVLWYQKAVTNASASSCSEDGTPDEGLDAEGRYDAAEDLLPVHRIVARVAEMHMIGGYGLKQDFEAAGDLFNQAGELASTARQGRSAAKYFELAEEAYSQVE